ncbi:MAG: hypothetical protein ABI700_15300 [Chloroflexota bacterium]
MPVILRPEDETRFLDPTTPLNDVFALMLPLDGEDMEMYAVSPRLNAARRGSR